MNRDAYHLIHSNNPSSLPEYSLFMTESNVNFISNYVTSEMRNRYPSKPPFKVARESVVNAMLEVYDKDHRATQHMIHMVKNLLLQKAIELVEDQRTDSYDPRILNTPEVLGLHFSNPIFTDRVKSRKNDAISFTHYW